MKTGTLLAPAESGLIDATFVSREKRFTVYARLYNGTVVTTHLADSGRLTGLLSPGVPLRLRPADPASKRKTAFTTCMVYVAETDCWVSVEAARANRHAARLLDSLQFPWLTSPISLQREVRHDNHRFDFLVTDHDGTCWVEVKSVSWVVDGVGLFPDAPTERGVRHLNALTELAHQGQRTALLFLAQRKDAASVRPARAIDPAFADALGRTAEAGTRIDACLLDIRRDGSVAWLGRLTVDVGA